MQLNLHLLSCLKFSLVLILCLETAGAFAGQAADILESKPRADTLKKLTSTGNFRDLNVISSKYKKLHHPDSSHSPLKAIRHSALVPGWGQLYNHKWWKIPMIYTGLGLFGSSIISNQRDYKRYLAVYKYYRDQSGLKPGSANYELYVKLKALNYTQANVESIQGNAQRNMQLSILGFAGFWGLQIIDAYIDAKFIHSYTMDRNLSVDIKPGIITGSTLYAGGALPQITPVLKLLVTL